MPARGAALPQGRPHRRLPPGVPAPARRARLRGLPRRRPGHRVVRRPGDRRVPGAGAARPGRADPVARRPGLVLGCDRHVRHVVLRLQRAAPRRGAAAGAQGGLRHLLQRRPLHRRRALHGWVAPAPGRRRLPDVHGDDERVAAGAVAGGRLVGRRLATAGRGPRAVAGALGRGAARLAVLAAGLGAPRLRPDRLPDVRRGRVGGRLPQQHVPDWSSGCASRACRTGC